MIKVGIIGYGKMGKIRAEAVSACGADIIAVYDNDRNAFPAMFKPKICNNAMDILNNQEIDAVFICTPNYLNKELTISGMNLGKNIFCEKPPAFTADEVIQIQKIEKKTKKKLMYGFNHRHHDSVQNIKKIIESKECGKILWMRGRYGKSVDMNFFKNWRSKKKMSGGGILIDQGIHMLDLMIYMSGGFDKVNSFLSNSYWKKKGIEDNVFAILKNTKKNIISSIHSTMADWRHLFSLEIFMDKGYMVLNGLKTPSGAYGEETLTVFKNNSKSPSTIRNSEERFVYSVDNSWSHEVQHFFDCINNNNKIKIGNSNDALKVMKIIDKIYNYGKKDK